MRNWRGAAKKDAVRGSRLRLEVRKSDDPGCKKSDEFHISVGKPQ